MQNAGSRRRGSHAEDVGRPLQTTFDEYLRPSHGKTARDSVNGRGKPFAFEPPPYHMGHPIARCTAALTMAGAVACFISYGQLYAQDGFRFRSSVELVNVNVTVTDRSGRFVPGLQQADFVVYDDDQPVEVTYFSSERVPVSLGIVLDTSGSMAGDKIQRARDSIESFLDQLHDPDDEIFLYGFASDVRLIQEWTNSRDAVSASLRRVDAVGGTAMYDAIIEAVPKAQGGRNRKKAIVLISDGNDTNSSSGLRDVRRLVRETDVLVYAIGIDGAGEPAIRMRQPTFPPAPIPFPIPGRGRPGTPWPVLPQFPPTITRSVAGDRLNAQALREITDESGGRTEVVRNARDLSPATASIADELSKQYSLGYTSPGNRDGRWHSIRVEVRDRSVQVRARRGYLAS
jgi:Ca-activated chloride channel family protein